MMNLFLLLFSLASAKEVTINLPKVDPDNFKAEALAAGFLEAEVYLKNDRWFMTYADSVKKDPAPLIAAHKYVDRRALAAAERAEMKAIRDKWAAGTATDEEIKRATFWLLNSRLPK